MATREENDKKKQALDLVVAAGRSKKQARAFVGEHGVDAVLAGDVDLKFEGEREPDTPDASDLLGNEPSAADLDAAAAEDDAADATKHVDDAADTLAAHTDRELPDMDRATLGALLREGQRLAQHAMTRVALPEYRVWQQKVSEFMVHNGL